MGTNAKSSGKPVVMRLITENRRAASRYEIEETIEVGMVLMGSEVCSIRDRKVEIADAYAVLKGGELTLLNLYIAPYSFATTFGHEPKRARRLLAHRHELDKLEGKVNGKGYTLIPLQLYFKGSKVKLELGLARSKNTIDRRDEIKEREGEREARAAMFRSRSK